jgi:hypothetical protein
MMKKENDSSMFNNDDDMYYGNYDDNRPVTWGDVRRTRWRRFWISLIIGLIVLSCVWISTQSELNQITQKQNTSHATETAVNQQEATRQSQPNPGPFTIAQAYYTAISNQNYTSAYEDLTADATYNNKHISQADFVKLAKNKDAKDGPVTNFKVDGGAFSPTMNVEVTRKNGNSYTVSLDCMPMQADMDGPWKIRSFDSI